MKRSCVNERRLRNHRRERRIDETDGDTLWIRASVKEVTVRNIGDKKHKGGIYERGMR